MSRRGRVKAGPEQEDSAAADWAAVEAEGLVDAAVEANVVWKVSRHRPFKSKPNLRVLARSRMRRLQHVLVLRLRMDQKESRHRRQRQTCLCKPSASIAKQHHRTPNPSTDSL
jgi:hypothetical protein